MYSGAPLACVEGGQFTSGGEQQILSADTVVFFPAVPDCPYNKISKNTTLPLPAHSGFRAGFM
jgi:hypothetical protein